MQITDATSKQTPTRDLADYQKRVRQVLAPFESEADSWEEQGVPQALYVALGQAGLFRERWQLGAAHGVAHAMCMVTEVSRLNGGAALAISLHSEMFIGALQRSRHPSHREIVEQAVRGEILGCAAATETAGGSDLALVQTAAESTKTGFRLRGEKRYTTNGGSASYAVVYASVDRNGRRALSAFLVPLDGEDARVVRCFPTLGMRSTSTAHLAFDCALPADAAIGPPGSGLTCFLQCARQERLCAAAAAVANAERALRLARSFLRTRHQFGERLYDKQALRHRLVDCWTRLSAARSYLELVCQQVVQQGPVPHDQVAALKMHCSRVACDVLDECIQFLGGRGYTEHFPFERLWRDTRLLRIGGGTDELMCEYIGQALDVEDEESDRWLQALQLVDERQGLV